MSELEIRHSGVFTKNYAALIDKNIRFIINMGGTRLIEDLFYMSVDNSILFTEPR